MEKNIYATLDLTKSLKDFEVQVTKLLELTNVREWDGRILKRVNKKLEAQRLLSTGQCIALFLYNLSQFQEALNTAITRTQGWWYPETHRHGLRKRQILTVGNVLVTLILPYVVTRIEKKRKINLRIKVSAHF